jgi:hypothetical protein
MRILLPRAADAKLEKTKEKQGVKKGKQAEEEKRSEEETK